MPDPLKLLGLARRANRVALGAFAAEHAAKRGKAVLLLVAADASDNTLRMAQRIAAESRISLLRLPHDKNTMGRATGHSECAVAALTDMGLAKAIEKAYQSLKGAPG